MALVPQKLDCSSNLLRFFHRDTLFHRYHFPTGTMEGTFVEDDGSSSEQKMGLRQLLLECLDLNEEEILDFLKSSIDFRILYCTLSGVIPKMGSPIPPLPPPGPSPNPIPARKKTTSIPGGTTESSAAPNDGAGKNSISQVDMTRRENRAQDVPASEFKQEGSLVGTSEEVALENALSSISQLENQSVSSEDEPSRAHAVNNDSKEMSKRRLFRGLHSVANPAKKISLKNALGPISQREEALAFLLDKPFQERIVEENPTVNLVKQPQGSKTLDSSSETNPYESLEELVASEKNLISESNTTVAEERGQGNEDQSAVNSPDEDRTENLESKEHASKVTETNTGKGEFASVVRIDYNELAHDQGKTGQELLD